MSDKFHRSVLISSENNKQPDREPQYKVNIPVLEVKHEKFSG